MYIYILKYFLIYSLRYFRPAEIAYSGPRGRNNEGGSGSLHSEKSNNSRATCHAHGMNGADRLRGAIEERKQRAS